VAGVGFGLYKRHQHQQEISNTSREMACQIVWGEGCDD